MTTVKELVNYEILIEAIEELKNKREMLNKEIKTINKHIKDLEGLTK